MRKIIGVFIVLYSISISGGVYPTTEVRALLDADNRNAFVYVGNDTLKQFSKRRETAADCTISFKSGDADKPIGDGKAYMVSLIECPGFPLLGLRLRKDAESSKFHILGYWTERTLSNQALNQTTLDVTNFGSKLPPTGMLLVS